MNCPANSSGQNQISSNLMSTTPFPQRIDSTQQLLWRFALLQERLVPFHNPPNVGAVPKIAKHVRKLRSSYG